MSEEKTPGSTVVCPRCKGRGLIDYGSDPCICSTCQGNGTIPAPSRTIQSPESNPQGEAPITPKYELGPLTHFPAHDAEKDQLREALTSAEEYIANLVSAAAIESPGMDTSKFPAWVMRKAVPYHDPVKERLAEELEALFMACVDEVNEKGAGGFLLARITDARLALAQYEAEKGGSNGN